MCFELKFGVFVLGVVFVFGVFIVYVGLFKGVFVLFDKGGVKIVFVNYLLIGDFF